MATNARITSEFWNDPRVRHLSFEQKIAALWLQTNSYRNNIGLTVFNDERFQFDTGLHPDVCKGLTSTVPALVVSVVHKGALHMIYLEFIENQYSGKQLSPVTSFCQSLCRQIEKLPGELISAVLGRYPHIAAGVSFPTVGGEGRGTPPPPPIREGTVRDCIYPIDKEVFDWAKEWPGEMASGVPPMPEAWVDDWLAKVRSRGGEDSFPAKWKEAMIATWRRDFRSGRGTGTVSNNGSRGQLYEKNGGEKTMWELQKQIEALREEVANHPANEQSANYVSDQVTAEDEQDLAVKQAEIKRLNKQVSGFKK